MTFGVWNWGHDALNVWSMGREALGVWSDGHEVLRVRNKGHESSSVRRCDLAVVSIHPRCLVIVASPFIPTLRTPRHSPVHSTS